MGQDWVGLNHPFQHLAGDLLAPWSLFSQPLWIQASPNPSDPVTFHLQLGSVYTEGGFVEGVNKKLSLLGGDSVDIFKGIPFATAKTLENPERHPGWQGGCWVLGWPWA